MERSRLAEFRQTLEGEYLKTAAEFALHSLMNHDVGPGIIAAVRGGRRIVDSRLNTEVAGLQFENPVMVGAGWDKKGWAVDGLYELGFAGTEVGSVLVHPQTGNPKPRLWTNHNHRVGLNRLGFNSSGQETVAANLAGQERPGVVGISLGKNKLTPDNQAPWAHAAVAERLHEFADYFVINVASPNTPGLRNLLNKEPLTEIVQAVQAVLAKKGSKPLFIKTTVDLAIEDLDNVIEVCLDEGATGLIDTNTTIDVIKKARYGWTDEMGGVSGDDEDYRQLANARMRHITKVSQGTGLRRIGVGGISNADHAYHRLRAGAEVLQVVTGIRPTWGRVAHQINHGLLDRMNRDGVKSVQEYVGLDLDAVA